MAEKDREAATSIIQNVMSSELNSVAQYPKHLLQEFYSSDVQGIERQIKASNGRPYLQYIDFLLWVF